MLPQKLEVKNRLSHSVEIKRITIVRGDKYKNIQITHIIAASKPNLDKYNFHIFEKLSTVELNTKPLDLTKIKLYIKKDPNAKSFYNTSCRNVPLKSAEKILRTVHYQHARGKGMTNLKTENLNSKFYQSGITNIPVIKYTKNAPIIKIITEFRTPSLGTSRNQSYGDKYNTNYKFNNQTYNQVNPQRGKITVNKEITTIKVKEANKKENEEKNKFSQINYNTQNNNKKIVPQTTKGNNYASKTYTNNRYNNNYNTNKPKEVTKKEENKKIVVNINTRPNTNNYQKNQNQTNIQNNQQNKKDNISNDNKDIKKDENIPTKENLEQVPIKVDSEKKEDKNNKEVEKPKYVNKLPLTVNINLDNQNIKEKDNKIVPISKENTNIEKGKITNQNTKVIEPRNYVNKTNNYSIRPQTNIKNPTIPNKIITTNININKPIPTTQNKITTTNININRSNTTNTNISNRNGNQYKNSNLSKVTTTSSRPIVAKTYSHTTPSNINKVVTSNRQTGMKKENGGANVNNIAIKYQKPETKKITTTDIKNIPSRGLNNQSNVTQTLNKNISMNGTPLEKSSNISKTSNISINTNVHPKTDIKINVNINNNIPLNVRTNVKTREKPNYRCITYARPSKNTTNVTHYINRISTNSSNGDNNSNVPKEETKLRSNIIQASNLSKVSINQNKNQIKTDIPLKSEEKKIDNISNIEINNPEIRNQEILENQNKEKKIKIKKKKNITLHKQSLRKKIFQKKKKLRM